MLKEYIKEYLDYYREEPRVEELEFNWHFKDYYKDAKSIGLSDNAAYYHAEKNTLDDIDKFVQMVQTKHVPSGAIETSALKTRIMRRHNKMMELINKFGVDATRFSANFMVKI